MRQPSTGSSLHHATSAPSRITYRRPRPASAGHAAASESRVKPAASRRRAAVATAWNGDGEASMNAHRSAVSSAEVSAGTGGSYDVEPARGACPRSSRPGLELLGGEQQGGQRLERVHEL